MTNDTSLIELNVCKLLTEDHYIVPIYQRNYAWTNVEVEQLVSDIYDAFEKDKNKNYYIGSLVVNSDLDGGFEVIDGQQRLTSLHIIARALNALGNNQKNNLDYAHRTESTASLQAIANSDYDNKHNSIERNYFSIKSFLNDKKFFGNDEFKKFFLEKVVIYRTQVLADTDLNHYFEIMNNRGEQLEKHEVLKAKLMRGLKDQKEAQHIFAMIWDACSDMNRYALMGFERYIRDAVFGTKWDQIPSSFEDILQRFKDAKNKKTDDKQDNITIGENKEICNPISISELIKKIEDNNTEAELIETKYEKSERFSSVIDFPNFLMHALFIFNNEGGNSSMPLDDKALITHFQTLNDQDKIKKFSCLLLKLRLLFDRYIIKIDNKKENNEHWSLLTLNKNLSYTNTFGKGNDDEGDDEEIQKQIIHLQSMFHVSFSAKNYKYWLLGILIWLEKQNEIQEDNFVVELERIMDGFYFDRFKLSEPKSYQQIIFSYNGNNSYEEINSFLHQGTNVNNYIFNRLDYLLLKSCKKGNNIIASNSDKDRIKFKNFFDKFRFSFTNSVEHYYPQNPLDEELQDKVSNIDDFGNLCLIHQDKNSRLSNFSPKSKKEYYADGNYDSIKQAVMMSYNNWVEKEIMDHSEKMIKLLNKRASEIGVSQ